MQSVSLITDLTKKISFHCIWEIPILPKLKTIQMMKVICVFKVTLALNERQNLLYAS